MFAHSVFTKKNALAFEGKLDIYGISPLHMFRVMHRIGPQVGMLETKYIFDDKEKLNIEFIEFSIEKKPRQEEPKKRKRVD